MIHEHGGDIYGQNILYDFSANLNPLGMPESVRRAAVSAIETSERYPDPYCRELVRKLAEHERFAEDNIVCGNGADDLIYRIIRALRPRNAVIAVPTFSEYAKALSEAGCIITEHRLSEDSGFVLGEDILEKLTDGVDLLVLCSPNNPTGRLNDAALMRRICGMCADKGIVLLCDECFIDLTGKGLSHSAKGFIDKSVIVLKAFTKTYSMAGLRLGYALFGDTELAEKVRTCGQFWSVSAPAQAAGLAALDETEYVEAAVRLIADEREYLSEMLRQHGFTVYPSDANFILFRCALPLDELLIGEKILIRSCANYRGLDGSFFRIAVRTHDENEALCQAVGKIEKQKNFVFCQ